jgi:hypothetical protein
MAVSVPASATVARRSEHLFFGAMSAVILAVVFVGFMRTFYMPGAFGRAAPDDLRVVHGTVFTAWVILFAVQTSLIARGRGRVHRALGWVGAALAATMIVLGYTLAIEAAREGHAPLGLSPLAFLIIPIFDMLVFGTLVAAAVLLRRRSAAHKRLMLLATLSILAAPLARVTGTPGAGGPLFFFGVADLLILAGVVYDRRTRGAVHGAYKWGGTFVVVSQVARLALAQSPLWLAIARAITRA